MSTGESGADNGIDVNAKPSGNGCVECLETGEAWLYDYRTRDYVQGQNLAPPHAHPENQAVPGPGGKVPENWRSLLH